MIVLQGQFDAGYAMGPYTYEDGTRSLLGEAVYRYHLNNSWYLVDSLARWASSFLKDNDLLDFDIVIATPGLKVHMGYEPGELLSDWVSSYTAIPRATNLLRRLGSANEFNSESSFIFPAVTVVTDRHAVAGKRVLLLDGLYGYGRNVDSAVQALRLAGAKTITVLACTKVDVNYANHNHSFPS